uniref:Large ribosomal subunit protein uL22m n=1 Tax=Ornithorhynchus anatinus TaxID=9258 RepID=F7C7C5_ORNAN
MRAGREAKRRRGGKMAAAAAAAAAGNLARLGEGVGPGRAEPRGGGGGEDGWGVTGCVGVAGAVCLRGLRRGGAPAAAGLFSSPVVSPLSHIHTSASLDASFKWEKKNNKIYPPQLPDEPRRPAEVYHCRRQIKYSNEKMWYVAKLVRGMSIDQALAQLEFNDKKGAKIVREVLLEAQDLAVRKHNVEFKSNLYIAESTSGRGQYLKRIRYHGRGGFGIMKKGDGSTFSSPDRQISVPLSPETGIFLGKETVDQCLLIRRILEARNVQVGGYC